MVQCGIMFKIEHIFILEPETQEQAMVKAWLDCANLRKVARQFNIPHTAQAKYIIVKELKSMLASVLEK